MAREKPWAEANCLLCGWHKRVEAGEYILASLQASRACVEHRRNHPKSLGGVFAVPARKRDRRSGGSEYR